MVPGHPTRRTTLPTNRLTRRLVVALAAVVATALGAGSASAATLAPPAEDCSQQQLGQPFLRFLDPFNYVLLPDGGFENGAAGWKLTGGAAVVAGNEPFRVHGAADAFSLSLPSGSSATSPTLCMGLLHPTLRLFAANSGSLLNLLKIEVLFDGPLGLQALPLVTPVIGTSAWSPTLPMPFLANATSLLEAGGTQAVAFRFTPVGLGRSGWRIDDVYLDPYKSR